MRAQVGFSAFAHGLRGRNLHADATLQFGRRIEPKAQTRLGLFVRRQRSGIALDSLLGTALAVGGANALA